MSIYTKVEMMSRCSIQFSLGFPKNLHDNCTRLSTPLGSILNYQPSQHSHSVSSELPEEPVHGVVCDLDYKHEL